MKPLAAVLVFASVISSIATSSVQAEKLPGEVIEMKQRFSQEVGSVLVEEEREKALLQQVTRIFSSEQGTSFRASQYFLLADRNPNSQIVALIFFDEKTGESHIIGIHKTSTGNPNRVGFYETPVGVFKNTPAHMSYRALGTKNKKGWRGFGAKGSRVWDLGWQESRHPKGGPIHIRLLVHATDPDFGEPKLGTPDSKGCIRISAKLNRFLDYYGILDSAYEENVRGKHVLLRHREPAAFAGSFIVVVDSRG